MLTVKFSPVTNPPGKLADAELHFGPLDRDDAAAGTVTRILDAILDLAGDALNPSAYRGIERELRQLRDHLHQTASPLEGLKLIGFGIWERRTGGGRNVTFPARQYSVNGERRAFALLRPIADATAQNRIRDLILQAYAEYEQRTGDLDATARNVENPHPGS